MSPVYEYICGKCRRKEDIFKPLSKINTLEFCPCNTKYPMDRLIGNAGGFRLKGDGWGQDGYDKYLGDINKTRRINGKPPVNYEDIHGPIE